MTFLPNKMKRLFQPKQFLAVTLPIASVVFVSVYLFTLSLLPMKPVVIHISQKSLRHRKTIRRFWEISNDIQVDDAMVSINTPTHRRYPFFRSTNSSTNKNDSFQIKYCNPLPIQQKFTFPTEDVACKPHVASATGCDLAELLYKPNENFTTCRNSRSLQICKFSETIILSANLNFNWKCSFSVCLKYNFNNVIVWQFSKDIGTLEKQGLYTDSTSLEKVVSKLARTSSAVGYNFLFLECSNTFNDDRRPNSMLHAQLLLLPPSTKHRKQNDRIPNNSEQKINLNIVLLDSAARSHFYRSLPETLATFNEINKNKNSNAEILDFQSFQSVEGHTAENVHALFTGTLFPKNFTGTDREISPAGVGNFFGRFSSKGYETFYQDDLCYEEYWGVRLELGSPSSFYEFEKAFRRNHINHSGLTFSSCQVLSSNNLTSPFNGPEGPICFNGRHSDAYHLDFIHLYHKMASRQKQRLLSYSALNVMHDYTGLRIQSIDHELAQFVTKMAQSTNTLTLLLADHGNTYTHYTHAVMEGRFEQYHPAFFMIIPNGVRDILGDEIMKNLRSNQLKLFTMLHVHQALIHIPDHPKLTGIFGEIPANRTCNDLDLRLPNLCVCEGWDVESLNDTEHITILDFAAGQLNNKIQGYQKSIRENKQIPNCKKLVPIYFLNVRERNEGKYLITSLDFRTAPGRGATQQHDIFHVEVQSEVSNQEESRNMKLLSFDRLSEYAPYRSCRDKSIDMRLCVCDIESSNGEKLSMEEFLQHELMEYPRHTPYDLTVTKKATSACTFLRMLSYPEITAEDSIYSASYEIANFCPYEIGVILYLKLENMKFSTSEPLKKKLAPYTTTYIGSASRTVPYWYSNMENIKLVIESSTTE